jgi:hypothetical protein
VELKQLKQKLRKQGITYRVIAKTTGIKEWKLKQFFSDRKLSDEDTIQVLTSIHKAMMSKNKLKSTINQKRKKILSQ